MTLPDDLDIEKSHIPFHAYNDPLPRLQWWYGQTAGCGSHSRIGTNRIGDTQE